MFSYEECNYIAALEVDDNFESNNSISKLKIYESLFAVFHYKGKYWDIAQNKNKKDRKHVYPFYFKLLLLLYRYY